MLFMCGTYFALRSGQEHRALRLTPSQIELVERPDKREYLRYTECLKNIKGVSREEKAK